MNSATDQTKSGTDTRKSGDGANSAGGSTETHTNKTNAAGTNDTTVNSKTDVENNSTTVNKTENRTNVNITVEQQTEIRQVVKEVHVEPVREVNFRVSVGTSIPKKTRLEPLPPRIIKIVPQYETYRFFILADGRIVIVDPTEGLPSGRHVVPPSAGGEALIHEDRRRRALRYRSSRSFSR